MAALFSDHFAGDTLSEFNSQSRAPAGAGRGRLRYQRAEVFAALTGGSATGDTARMMTLKSSDRLVQLFFMMTHGEPTYKVLLGLAKSGAAHDGPMIDNDILAQQSVTIPNALDHDDKFGTGLPDPDLLRGAPLWKIVTGYASDPMESWDVVISSGDSDMSSASTMLIEAYYTSGD